MYVAWSWCVGVRCTYIYLYMHNSCELLSCVLCVLPSVCVECAGVGASRCCWVAWLCLVIVACIVCVLYVCVLCLCRCVYVVWLMCG